MYDYVLGGTHNFPVDREAAEPPEARVVYVDIDPMVRAYSGELVTDDGTTAIVTADLRDPARLLADPELRALINFGEPAGLLMTAVLHFVADSFDPCALVASYSSALAPGSYLALSHGTYQGLPSGLVQTSQNVYARATQNMHLRSREEIERFFTGLQIVPPCQGAEAAVAHVGLWGAEDPDLADSDGSRWWLGAVARRP
jgi:hypothetical protein